MQKKKKHVYLKQVTDWINTQKAPLRESRCGIVKLNECRDFVLFIHGHLLYIHIVCKYRSTFIHSGLDFNVVNHHLKL